VIHLHLPMLPLSINAAYMHVRKGMATLRVLTTEGRKFKKEATAHLSKKYPLALVMLKANKPFDIFMRFTVTNLENKGWVNRSTDRYKGHDATNRIKVMEDVLVDISGVDDKHFMLVACQKVQGSVEGTDIYIWSTEDEGSPFHAAALSLGL
jgi:hypothetical protein